MADREPLYAGGQAGDYWAEQRRIADGRGDDAAAGAFWGDCVRVSAAGHGALSEVFCGALLDTGIWDRGGSWPVPCSVCVFAISPCGGGDEISGGAVFDGG